MARAVAPMQRVVDDALARITAAEGSLLELADGEDLVSVAAAGDLLTVVGVRRSPKGTLAGLALETRDPLRCRNSEDDPRVDLNLCRRLGVRSLVATPVDPGDDRPLTAVLTITAGVIEAFTDDDVDALWDLAHEAAEGLIGVPLPPSP